MTFTTITSVSALDFTNEELDIGDTAAFVTKMNSYMAKIQAQMNQVSVAIGDINTVGAEQSTAASTAAALQITLDASIAAVEAVQTTLDAAVLEFDTAVADFANLSALTPAEATALSDALDALIVATSVVLLTGIQTVAGVKTFTSAMNLDSNLNVGGDLDVGDGTDGTNVNPIILIDAGASGNPSIRLSHQGVLTSFLTGRTDYISLVKDEAADNYLRIYNDYSIFNNVVRGVTPVGTTDLTTKAYVDTFAPLASPALTGNATLSATAPYLRLKSVTGQSSHLEFQTNDLRTALIYGGVSDSDGRLILKTYLADGSSSGMQLIIYDDFAVFDKVVRGVTPVGTTDLTTKDYVDTKVTAPVIVSGTTDTLAAGDVNVPIRYTNASLVTVTIPTDASDDLADGFTCILYSEGAGGVTLSTTGITLTGSSPNTTIAQNEALVVIKTAVANTWMVIGGTSA